MTDLMHGHPEFNSHFRKVEPELADELIEWCTDINPPSRERIGVSQAHGAETKACCASGRLRAIEFVARDGQARLGKMNPNLMRAPGERVRLDQCEAVACLQDTEVGFRFPAATRVRFHPTDPIRVLRES